MTAERKAYVENNLALAQSCVKRYAGRGIEYDDLFQAACLGLVKAAEKFDESRQLKFSTYAVPVILGELKQLFRSGGSIKISRHIKELGIRALKAGEKFSAQNGRQPHISELAALLLVSEQELAEALCAVRMPDSLDADETGAITADADSFEEPATECLALRQILAGLSEADRAIITERYVNEKTQSQTAKLLGMTQVQVSRRERRILSFMRGEIEK